MKNTTSPAAKIAATVTMTRSEFGTPRPTIRFNAPEAHWRTVRAFAFEVAAKIERATPAREQWSTQIVDNGLYLELADGTDAEAQRGMDLLRKVVFG